MNHTNWFVYIVQCNDNSLYTGITTDIDRRINEHNTSLKGAKYTRNKRPVTIVYFEMAIDRSMASKRESEIKKLSRSNKLKLIDHFKIILN